MSLSAAQINAIYAALFGPTNLPSAAQLAAWEALDATQGDNAVLLGIVNSPLSMQNDYAVVQVIQFVSGGVPNAAQLQGWVSYLESGGSLTSVVSAFAGSTNFQTNFNNGNPVNVNAPVNATIMQNILFNALGTIPSQGQVQAWVSTGLSIAQVVAEFALGDQYSARTASFVQNYLVTVAAHAAGLPGAAAPSGTLFGVPALITITDNTAINIPPEETTAGNTVTFTVTGVGVSTGTQETWSLSGTALSEVVGPTSGTLTFNSAGTASITVATGFNNIAAGTLTLSLTSVTGVTPDTVTIIAPAIQHFTATVGEILTGGPAATVFEGTVDTQVVNNNTLSNVVDVAQGNALFHNTEWITIDSTAVAPLGLNQETIEPASTGVQVFKFTNLDNYVFGPTQIDGSMMANVNEISSFGSSHDTNVFNLQNAITTIDISNSDAAGSDFLGVIMTNAVATANPGGFAQVINLSNAATQFLEDETTNGTDVVNSFTINSLAGTNSLTIDGTSIAKSIIVTDGGASVVTSIHSVDDTEALNLVDLTGTSGTVTIGGIEASEVTDGNGPLAINEGSGADTEFVAVEQGATLNITGTTSSGGSSAANVFFNNGDGLQTVTDTQNNNNNDSLDVDNHGDENNGAFSTVTATFGNGNDNASIEVGQTSQVNVSMGNGNDNVSVAVWENSTFGSGSQANVTVGSGTNTVSVDTRENGSDNDIGSQVTVVANQANSANSQTITVTVGNAATVDIDALGIGVNSVTVNSDDLTANITVGNGTNTVTVNSDTASAADQAANQVTIFGGNGTNNVTVNGLANGSVVTETLGSGTNTISDDVVLGSGPNAGGVKFVVNVGLGVADGNDTVTINLEGSGASHANNVSVTTGTGNDSVSILNNVVSDVVNVSAGAGNDRVYVDFFGSNVTLNGGADTVSLATNGLWTNGDTLASTAAAFQANGGLNVEAAHISGFENLELTTAQTGDINVQWIGTLNNIVKVVLDGGFNFEVGGPAHYLAGLNPGTEIDLLAPSGNGANGDSSLGNDVLLVPLNGSGLNHAFSETLVLNAAAVEAASDSDGPFYFGAVAFNTGASNWIDTIHIFSENTAADAEGEGAPDDGLTNVIAIQDHNPTSTFTTLDLAGDQNLHITGGPAGATYGLLGVATIQDAVSALFTGGLTDIDLTSGHVGELGDANSVTINLSNSDALSTSTIDLGNANDSVTLGNGTNTVSFGSGTDSYTGGNGTNNVFIGDYAGSSANGGVDTLSFGAGSNTVTLSPHDTLAANGSGTSITFAAHGTNVDTVVFNSVFNSGYNLPDTITGFNSGTDKLDVSQIDGSSGNVHFYVASTAPGVLATVATDAAGHFDVVYDNTTGQIYIDHDGSQSLTAGSGDMQIDVVGATGLTLAQLQGMFHI